MSSLLSASSYVAFTALIHNLNKLKQQLALPDLFENSPYPFSCSNNSLDINIEDIINIADNVAAGVAIDNVQTSNHTQQHLFSLLEQVKLNGNEKPTRKHYYPLKALTAKSIFPVPLNTKPNKDKSVQTEYLSLWNEFKKGIKQIPASHQENKELWLDHFETACQCFTSNMPSINNPDVSLYDHSKTTAALATALWRYAKEQTDKSAVENILKLFGMSANSQKESDIQKQIGVSRLGFWDCALTEKWEKRVRGDNQLLTEAKSKNTIDRITSTAGNPRQTERVPAGAEFDFKLTLRQFEGDSEELLELTLKGLRLLELDSLGGSGSRGYGKIAFEKLTVNGIDRNISEINPFA